MTAVTDSALSATATCYRPGKMKAVETAADCSAPQVCDTVDRFASSVRASLSKHTQEFEHLPFEHYANGHSTRDKNALRLAACRAGSPISPRLGTLAITVSVRLTFSPCIEATGS
jgi:hypothetical protein